MFFSITKTTAWPGVLCGSKGNISYNNSPSICAEARALLRASVLDFEEVEGLLLNDMIIFSRAHLLLIGNRQPFERHKTVGDATAAIVLQHHCSYMQSLLCTALNAIELKRDKSGNQREENCGVVRGGDPCEDLVSAGVGEGV